MTTLKNILTDLSINDADLLINDGANTWDADNLLEALQVADDAGATLDRQAIRLDHGIAFIGEDGFQESLVAFRFEN